MLTLVLGTVGALVGGLLAVSSAGTGRPIPGFVIAVLGAIILRTLYRFTLGRGLPV